MNEISVKFDWVFLKFIHLDVNADVNSLSVYHVISHAPSPGITASAL